MLACTALVGCTNDDVIDNPANEKENGKADAYVSVKLIMTESTGSRAATDGGYAKGEINEQKINGANSVFLFYDEEGNWVTSGQLMNANNLTDGTNSDDADHSHTGDGVETDVNSVYDDAYIVLSGPDQELRKSTQVLTIVNYNADAITAIKNSKPSLKEVLPMIASNPVANTGFLMTTSVYYNSTTTDGETTNKVVQTTPIVADTHIQDTQAGAKSNPVKIYIERASAKVQLTTTDTDGKAIVITSPTAAMPVVGDQQDDTGDEAGDVEGADIVLNGEQTPVGIIINGWTINNVNKETYLVKKDWSENIPTAWPSLATWNQADDYRSYWAVGTKWDYEGSEIITTDEAHELEVYTYNDAESASNYTNSAMYCYEQTVAEHNVDPTRATSVEYPNVTTVLIAAQIALPVKDANGNITGYTAATEDLFKYGGVFYKKEQLKTAMMNLIDNYWIVETTTTNTYTKAADTDTELDSDMTIEGVRYKLSDTPSVEKTETNLVLGTDIDFNLVSDGTLAGIKVNQLTIKLEQDDFGETVQNGSTSMAEGDESFTIITKVKQFVRDYTNGNTSIRDIIVGGDNDANFSWTETQTAITTLFNNHAYITETVGYQIGKCYYQIPIEHLYSQSDTDNTNLYGVVRNHWYKLNVSSVKHIGEPVYKPEEKISRIPAKSTDYYLAAEIHVLSWHVVNQDVTLE